MVSFNFVLATLLLWAGTSIQAEELTTGNPLRVTVEFENQTPCFFFGGYQFSAGIRYDNIRIRAGVQDSGRADFESLGIDNQSGNFRRSYSAGSVSLSVDYFLNTYLFAYACLGSNRWLVQDRDTSETAYLRTLDAGLGLGFQYFIYKGLFIQFATHVYFRDQENLIFQNGDYTIPGKDISPGLRLGYQFGNG